MANLSRIIFRTKIISILIYRLLRNRTFYGKISSLHILIALARGNTILVKMYSLSLCYGQMCNNIERCVFRAYLNGTHFLILEDFAMKATTLLALILILVCVFSFSACDRENAPPNNDDTPSTQQPSNNNDGKPTNNNSSDKNTQCQHVDYNWYIINQPTCKEDGTKNKVCSSCNQTIETVSIQKLTTHTPSATFREN